MKALVGIPALTPPPAGAAVTIGTFDGVHLGHRALIAETVAEARSRALASIVVTWDRHPLETLRPGSEPALLTSPERKLELLEEAGTDVVAVLEFDEALASWPPERFAEEVLAAGLGARSVIVGRGWRFGRGASGDVALLEELGADLGFEAREVRLERRGGEAVSSSRARAAVASGDMEEAHALLGRAFDIDGIVVRGADRGKSLGFPTANLRIEPSLCAPPRGIYAGRAVAGGTHYGAAISLGVNPTFGGDPETARPGLEAHLLDFSGDLYGQTLRVVFCKRLRDELKFDSVDELVEQMQRDVAATRSLTC